MTNERRKKIYERQNGSDTRLTGPQRRRLAKKAHKVPPCPVHGSKGGSTGVGE